MYLVFNTIKTINICQYSYLSSVKIIHFHNLHIKYFDENVTPTEDFKKDDNFNLNFEVIDF